MLKQVVSKCILSSSPSQFKINVIAPFAWNLCRSLSLASPDLRRHSVGQHLRLKAFSDSYNDKWGTDLGSWSDENKTIYPPLRPEDGVRPAEVFHGRQNCRHHHKKMFTLARMVRGMDVDEAIARLDVLQTKCAEIMREVLREAKEIAVRDHNVEFASNMHIAASWTNQSGMVKFVRQHARGRDYINNMRFTNYHVMLREGPAPPRRPRVTAKEAADMYIDQLRSRTITDGL